MSRKANQSTEIAHHPETELLAPPPPGARLKAMIAQLVAERVDAALDEFQPKASPEVQRQKRMFEQRKHTLYFEKYGCQMCGTKKKVHDSNGLCSQCAGQRYRRYAMLKREWDKEHPAGEADREIERMTARVTSAERLLKSEE